MDRLLSAEFDVAFLALPHTLSSSVAGRSCPGAFGDRPVGRFRFRSIPLYEAVYGSPTRARACREGGLRTPRDPPGEDPEDAPCRRPGLLPHLVILGLYPLLEEGLIDRKGIVADCKTGVSGGGRGPVLGFHYPEVEGASGRTGCRTTATTGDGPDCRWRGGTGGDHLRPAPDAMVRGILATCYAWRRPG